MPGADEDTTGKPFVGRAGKYLHAMFRFIQLDTNEDLYITNIVKDRPPNNRPPTDEEMAACGPWLDEQIKIIQPKLIVAVGNTALKYFTGKAGITKMRGKWLEYKGVPMMPIYHPSYLLRNEYQKDKPGSPHEQTRADLRDIRRFIDADA